MIKTIKEYFKQKTESISFIQLKLEANVEINGYKMPTSIPLPLTVDELVNEIKERRAQEEIKISSIVNGIIYLIAADPDFIYVNEYKNLLYQINSNIEKYLLHNGITLINEEKLDEGIVYLKALTHLNNKNIEGLFNYGLGLEQKAQRLYKLKSIDLGNLFLNEATGIFEEIVEIDADFSLAYYKLGFHYLNLKQYKKCQIIWEKFIELDDDEERIEEIKEYLTKIEDDVTYEEGYNEILRGKPYEGLKKLLPLKEKHTDWWNLLFMIGLGYRQLGEYDKARGEFENVLAINPAQVDALNELGLCLAFMGYYEEAIEKFTKAIYKRPDDYEIICNRGMTYLQMGEIKRAEEDIQRAYEKNPNDEITISCKKEIERVKNMD